MQQKFDRTVLTVRRPALLVGTTAMALLLASCGSSGSGSGSSSAATGSGPSGALSATVDKSYTGPDVQYLKTLAKPAVKAGQSFRVGYLQINGAVLTLKAQQIAAEAAVKSLGGTMIVKDGQNNAQQQVDGLNELLNENVDALVMFPEVLGGLAAGVARAQARHIPVIYINAYPDSTKPPAGTEPTDVDQATDYSVYVTMKALRAKLGAGGTFAVLGFGLPVPSLVYQAEREKYWGQKLGLKFEGEQDAQASTASAYSTAASNIFQQSPKVGAVLTVNDEAALAASGSARQLGNTSTLIATSNGGDKVTVPLLKSGGIYLVYRAPFDSAGQQAVYAAYDQLTSQNLPLPKLIQVPGVPVTRANLSKVPFLS